MIPSEENSSGSLVELLVSINWGVLLIEAGVVDDHLSSLSHDWEDVWLSLLASVSTDTQVNLSWVLVRLVSDRERQDWVSWGLLNVGKFLNGGGLIVELGVQKFESIHFYYCYLKDFSSFIKVGIKDNRLKIRSV